jgi:hypothetical protein
MAATRVSTFFAAIDGGTAARVADALAADPALAEARDRDGVSATMHALYHGRPDVAATIAAALPELDVFEAAAVASGSCLPRNPPSQARARPMASQRCISRPSSGSGMPRRRAAF